MSELFARAAELRQSGQSHAQAELARREKLTAENNAKREESTRRAAEFIGVMMRNRVPMMPIYEHVYKRGQGGILHVVQIPNRTIEYKHLGDGWVVEPRRYNYDEGIVYGTFLTREGKVFNCDEVTDQKPSEPPHFTQHMTSGEHVLTSHGRAIDDDHLNRNRQPDPTENWGMTFADDDGLQMLASALIRYGISE